MRVSCRWVSLPKTPICLVLPAPRTQPLAFSGCAVSSHRALSGTPCFPHEHLSTEAAAGQSPPSGHNTQTGPRSPAPVTVQAFIPWLCGQPPHLRTVALWASLSVSCDIHSLLPRHTPRPQAAHPELSGPSTLPGCIPQGPGHVADGSSQRRVEAKDSMCLLGQKHILGEGTLTPGHGVQGGC